MKNIIRLISLVFLIAVASMEANAELNREEALANKQRGTQKAAADCVPATGSSQLSVNNVRVYITTAGSMWFKNSMPQYFIPKESQTSSMFAAALWIGGMDVAGQLKLAAIRFRQVGDDFWPGPLTLDAANIEQKTCALYDKIFTMTQKMAIEHRDNWDKPGYVMPDAIKNWPAHPIDGNMTQSQFLAPFFDKDENGIYEPEKGDYPYYDPENKLCPWTERNRLLAARKELPQTMESTHMFNGRPISTGGVMADQILKGDETLWWVFNDKGAAHTESRGYPIGLEIRAQAFGFATTDELNNMTFYSYEIINRSSQELTETYFSQWVDPDVGYATDDFVGCDVGRGLGYCYNGKTPDGNGLVTHYGENPPAVGVDFFQGPYLDPDGEDNPSYKGDNVHGPSFIKNYPGNDEKGCAIVPMNGIAAEFTWDSIGKVIDVATNKEKDTAFVITRKVTVRAEAINGVNFGDGIIDNERYGMRRFVYHNNSDPGPRGDPSVAIHYYNFLRGIWKDNVRMTFGKTGYNVGSTTYCDFMFPGDTDPCNWGTNGVPTDGEMWKEEGMNQYGDRRFMQSAGPFTLKKGAINYITVGIPWARATGSPWASVELLKIVDDKAQMLFENCFKVLDGPDAPDLVFREMDGKLICYITNAAGSTNYKEGYKEVDNTIPPIRPKTTIETVDTTVFFYVHDTVPTVDGRDSFRLDSTTYTLAKTITREIKYTDDERSYVFEGYQVYQLIDPTVKAGELTDINKAKLVFQCDIKNGIGEIINFELDAEMKAEVPRAKVKWPKPDQGISHSFIITEDKFATGSTDLVNYKKYYYMAIAYAHNSYAPYNTKDAEGLLGQKKPYLPGNKNIKSYTAIPHRTIIEENGTVIQSTYGTQPQIIQYEGQGNGGNALLLSKQTLSEILEKGKADSLIFEKNAGPVNVRVIDPLKVAGRDYTLRFCNADGTMANAVTNDTYWVLEYKTDNGTDTAVYSDTSINVQNEQLLLDLGISIFVNNVKFAPLDEILVPEFDANYKLYSSVNFINSTITYQNSGHPWYSGLPDMDGNTPQNWIRAGQTKDGDWTMGDQRWNQIRVEDFYKKLTSRNINQVKDTTKSHHTLWLDRGKQFEKIIGGTFAPYALASYYDGNPAYGFEVYESALDSAPGLGKNPKDITYPCMTELYSVDIVLTADTMLWTRCPVVEICNDPVFAIGHAVRHNLRKSPSVYRNGQPDNSGTTGMGWFPGYAICVETGERLNMMFAENSSQGKYNGANMKFDPTADYFGMHFLYVFGHRDLYKHRQLDEQTAVLVSDDEICPPYGGKDDGNGGEWLYNKFTTMERMPESNDVQRTLKSIAKNYIYKNVMWTGISLAHPQYTWLEKDNDVTIRIRVSRPYSRWDSKSGVGKQDDRNNNMPLYKFSTKDIETKRNIKEVAKNQMDSIYITPNPYYGISTGGYEASQVDTRVKIINLPKKCTIKIYTLNGTLIRQHSFESPTPDSPVPTLANPNPNPNSITYWEWDLKNSANIPIASGMYLIHIQDDSKYGTGAVKTLKFLCIQRPIDVNAF